MEVAMKTIDALKTRLTDRNTLQVQNEDGFVGVVGFEWNSSVTDIEISKFEKENSLQLPESYKEFLRISNGAILFKDMQYSQWGCKILGLEDLISTTKKVTEWGYKLNPSWLVYATWLGDVDLLIFDLDKYASKERNYIIDGEQGEPVGNWCNIKGDFSKWIDRLIISQGAKYWRWY